MQLESAVASVSHRYEKEPRHLPAPDSDWRWGVVVVDAQGKGLYSPVKRGAAGSVSFPLRGDEKEIWLAVTATPTEYHSILWDQMYYTIYRYPWMVEITGGHPLGGGPGPALPTADRQGAPHPNGGGWVDASAHVDPGAYVGPEAMVLETARVLGAARIDGKAIVSGNAEVSGSAVVRDHALATGDARITGGAVLEQEAAAYNGTVQDAARLSALTLMDNSATRITGHAHVAAVMNSLPGVEIGGSAELLGDLELTTPVSKGVFYGMVTPEMVSDAHWGANRTHPEREITDHTQPTWQE